MPKPEKAMELVRGHVVFDLVIRDLDTVPAEVVEELVGEAAGWAVVGAVVGDEVEAAGGGGEFAGGGYWGTGQEAGVVELAEDVVVGRVEVALGVHDEDGSAALGGPEGSGRGGVEGGALGVVQEAVGDGQLVGGAFGGGEVADVGAVPACISWEVLAYELGAEWGCFVGHGS